MVCGKWLLVLGMMQGHMFVSGEGSLEEACSSTAGAQCEADQDDVAMLQVQKVAMSTREGDEKPAIAGDEKPAGAGPESPRELVGPAEAFDFATDRESQHLSSKRYVDAIRSATGGSNSLEVQMAELASQTYLAADTADWKVIRYKAGRNDNQMDEDVVTLYEKRTGPKKLCAVGFAGTNSGMDLTSSANAFTKSYCGLDKRFHRGFINEIHDFFPLVESGAAFIANGSLCEDGIYVVGHSMGGAIAEIFMGCVDLARSNMTMTAQAGQKIPPILGIYTFGTPGISKDQLTDLSPEGKQRNECFVGARYYIMDNIYGDSVPVMSSPFGFIHPKLKAVRMKKASSFWGNKPVYSKTEYACDSDDAKNKPNSYFYIPSVKSHRISEYVRRSKKMYPGR